MNILMRHWLARAVRAAEDEGGGGATPPPGTSGDPAGEGAGGGAGDPPPPADPAKAAPPSGDDDPLKWLGVELDEKTRKGLLDTRTTTPEAMLKRMQAAEKMIRGNVLEAPPADPAGRAAWLADPKNRAALGVPENPDGYDMTPPEFPEDIASLMDWGTEREKLVASELHKLGLSAEQYAGARAAYAKVMTEQVKADLAAAVADRDDTFGALRREWGDAYDDRMRLAAETAKTYGVAPETAEALRRGKVIGGAALLKLLADAGASQAEDGPLIGGGTGPLKKTPQEWKTDFDAYGRENAAALQDPRHPEHQRRLTEWNALKRNAGIGAAGRR